jgi:hypothetical protein
MSTNKRITDLTNYKAVLPYASEIFGIYQPLLGWKSRRVLQRMSRGLLFDDMAKYKRLVAAYEGHADVQFNADHNLSEAKVGIGTPNALPMKPQHESVLLQVIAREIAKAGVIPKGNDWLNVINEGQLSKALNTEVLDVYKTLYRSTWQIEHFAVENDWLVRLLRFESSVAGVLLGYASKSLFEKLGALFFLSGETPPVEELFDSMKDAFDDPFLTFDPKKDVGDVSLSPIGIVHLYRQYFFELDTFLGTPVSHVWLSPGSTVELVESTSRKSVTEKTFETALEMTKKTESSTTDQDELSNAVKENNKDDMKLGFTATVNQSWGTGNATATGTLDMDKTQEIAREKTNKRMRQQSEKLSTEIRQNFKSTFKTVTESTDITSKRYVLANTTPDLINYELRRKMRQVGVQIQDIGSYLCWETFVDEPGAQLGLPNLVHIAKPADLIVVPNPQLIDKPPATLSIGFTGQMVWNFPNNEVQHGEDHPDVDGRFVPLNTFEITGIPNDYEVLIPRDGLDQTKANPFIEIQKSVISADGDSSWNFANNLIALGRITDDGKYVKVGVITPPKPGYFTWDKMLTLKVSGSITCQLTKAKSDEIDKANAALMSAKSAADSENQRKQEEAFRNTARDRITLASKITKRKFEDLREEERTIVYRNLIKALMTENTYRNLPETTSGYQTRHVLSELINAIFDVDKMLYFVAPEWWKPRQVSRLNLGSSMIQESLNDTLINWAGQQSRPDNYYITDTSAAPWGGFFSSMATT